MTRQVTALILATALPSLCAMRAAVAQSASGEKAPTWTLTVDVGAFIQGNRDAITSWLRHNAYGAPEKRCGFDLHLEPVCDPTVNYPQVTESGILARLATIQRRISDRTAIELLVATEQSGLVTGRCNDQALPKDARCTDRFIELEFGGASMAMIAVVSTAHVHFGVGPALLLANWRMHPAHLAGVWFDATADREPWPFFLRTQYRVYRSANFAPDLQFTGLRPSTLFMGLGFKLRLDN